MSNKGSFIKDQRGAVAFETPIVYLFIMMSLLLPLVMDLARLQRALAKALVQGSQLTTYIRLPYAA